MLEAQQMAMYLTSVVRNEMEDFHCRHLSDEQTNLMMAQRNYARIGRYSVRPLSRPSICTE
jgi:hypothetical protein